MRLETGCRLPQDLPKAVPLLADSYWERSNLPAVPKVFGHVSSEVPWGALGNAGQGAVGDCTIAGVAHQVMLWKRASSGAYPIFADATVRKQYFTLTGGQDSGLDPVKVATWWVKDGIADAGGNHHRIRGYSRLGDVSDLDVACYMYGCLGLILDLPNSAKYEFLNGEPWSDTSQQGASGHYAVLCGRNSAQNWTCITWGRVHAITPSWMDKYLIGAMVYYSSEYLLPSGVSPEAIKADVLEQDLQRFAQ